jgi:hypothetical protein
MQRNNVQSAALVNIQAKVDKFVARLVNKDKRHWKWVKLFVPNAKPVDL